jgi:hypothetical protein
MTTPQYLLPEYAYAEVAPLPIPLAEHLYTYLIRNAISPLEQVLERMLSDIAEKRRYFCIYMDSFVKNQDKALPYTHKFNSRWLASAYAQFAPDKKKLDPRTFADWIKRGYMRMDSKGQPAYESAVALLLLRALIQDQYLLLPGRIDESETWYCYAQRSPEAPIETIRISERASLPSFTLIWTHYPGIYWRDYGWKLVGDFEGAITWAGVTAIDEFGGNALYDLTIDDIMRWIPAYQAVFRPIKGRTSSQVQALAQLALVDLTNGRL